MEKLWMQEMSWPEIKAKLQETDIVLIPAGSTEQHGPHLPLGVDTFIPIYIAEEVAKRTGVPIAPPIWFAPCEWHMGFPGTISIRPTTLISLLFDICRSLRRHGFRNFIIINGHTSGNNPALISAADEIQTEMPDVRVWVVDVVLMAKKAVLDVCEAEILYHADEVEASQMLVAREDLVQLEKAKKIIPKTKSRFIKLDYRPSDAELLFRPTAEDWRNLTSEGNIGDPTIASEEKGKVMMEALIENVVEFINDLKKDCNEPKRGE